MTWTPTNNQYDGVNAYAVGDVELNAPFYDWDIQYFPLAPVILYAPLLTRDSASTGGGDDDGSGYDPVTGEPVSKPMREMIVPAERGRSC